MIPMGIQLPTLLQVQQIICAVMMSCDAIAVCVTHPVGTMVHNTVIHRVHTILNILLYIKNTSVFRHK